MKRLFTFFFGVILVQVTSAQFLTPTVISSAGGYASNASGSISYTVGEMAMIKTAYGGGSILTQGFQQPANEEVLGLQNMTKAEFGSMAVYPNPTVENLWFAYQFPEAGKVTACIYNAMGQKVGDVYSSGYEKGKTAIELNITNYSAGVYLLSLSFASNNGGNTHLISKQFTVLN